MENMENKENESEKCLGLLGYEIITTRVILFHSLQFILYT